MKKAFKEQDDTYLAENIYFLEKNDSGVNKFGT